MFTLTELEKTVLLAVLVFAKGSLTTYITEQQLTVKFPIRKKILVREALKDLTKANLLEKDKKQQKYKLTKEGQQHASKLLHQGAKLWYLK
ncbi:MAG: hypothetical protein J4428_04290 [Candidatus Aenigmarchaeota archaeon]|nr:hypothetical protein [Candidatus Aenigmarchaeota archaeon]